VAVAEKLATEIDKGKRRFGGLGYRIDLKLQESEGDKKLHSRLYAFVTEARQSATVTVKRRATVQLPEDPAPETRPPSDSSTSSSVECRILMENERTLELSVEAEFASGTTTMRAARLSRYSESEKMSRSNWTDQRSSAGSTIPTATAASRLN
jgi:hypothetical protein